MISILCQRCKFDVPCVTIFWPLSNDDKPSGLCMNKVVCVLDCAQTGIIAGGGTPSCLIHNDREYLALSVCDSSERASCNYPALEVKVFTTHIETWSSRQSS
jgi:hypothetical protein